MRRESRKRSSDAFIDGRSGGWPDEAIPLFRTCSEAPTAEYYRETVRGVWERRAEIDELIAGAEHWRIERMALVDRNILRLGVYEMIHGRDIPYAVAINEGVDLGKRFGAEESGAFINGILDKVSEIVRKKTDRPRHRQGG